MDPLKVSEFIKKIRKENNLTQKKLADKYNVTYQAVSKWENGKNIPDVAIIKQMSKDFNISVDDILDGKVTKSKKTKIITRIFLTLIFFALVGVIVFLSIYINDSYNFKTISTSCDEFEVSGSIAYDKKKSSIYISNIEYCGGDDEVKYKNIESVLYERQRGKLVEIDKETSKQSDITLEEYLKKLKLNIDNYSKACKNYNNNSLVLEINAKKNNNKIVTYKIPLELKENCN